MPTMQQPEVYLAHIEKSVDEQWNLNDGTKSFLSKAVEAYIDWFNLQTK